MINLGEADDPYLIFESLNHKGKPLNQADLVRNYVLMRFQHSTSVGGEQEIVYEELWRPMESRLNGVMPEFLRHYGMRGGRNVRKGDIYIASKFEMEKLNSPAEVKASLANMKEAAFTYQKFLNPLEESDPRIAKRLKGILELDSTVFYPFLIRLYHSWEHEEIGIDEFLRCLDHLESFYVRRLVCGVPTNALNKITLELCLNLTDSKLDGWLHERLTHGAGSRHCPNDQEFSEALVVQRIYPRHKIARYMLVALEESHQHKEPVDIDSATIEHVMPQTLSPEWKIALGIDCADLHDRWLDTLGNLTLTGYNSELGNDTFDEKKVKLQNTHFELSRSLLNYSQWGAAEIEDRGRKLAGIALQRWRLE
ncbi:HNH endonuclease family protein [Nitrosomonas sp.]|uniref:HNH endonuclease family protein n=1 Tax=Nitrosomonas sp. TaxID=42353 RepID=UPI0037C78C0A